MHPRTWHQQAVRAILDQEFSPGKWEFKLPHGWGNETYFAHGNGQTYFVKLGAPTANYEVMALLGLTPPVLRAGALKDGTSFVIQPFIEGKKPSWADFRLHLEKIATIVNKMHHHPKIRQVLKEAPSESHRELAIAALTDLRYRWKNYKRLAPAVADEVERCLDLLEQEIEQLESSGIVASHNDICNANWIITPDRKIYLIDLDDMSLDDPAHDLGALLWWYYPPELRGNFLEIAGYEFNESLRHRMRLRMAVHSLHILLPREHSYDQFNANHFINMPGDFKAILANQENPRGYEDE